jgi:hypothetical protein
LGPSIAVPVLENLVDARSWNALPSIASPVEFDVGFGAGASWNKTWVRVQLNVWLEKSFLQAVFQQLFTGSCQIRRRLVLAALGD